MASRHLPNELHELIIDRNRGNNRSRVVAGYCWEWASKRHPAIYDIVMTEHYYQRRWNLIEDGSLWIMAENSISDVGCIHTCQGLEVDYVGVIIGPDLVVKNGRVVTVPERRARSDKSLSGLRRLAKIDPTKAAAEADRIIKNTYRALLTRGLRGCYVLNLSGRSLPSPSRACLSSSPLRSSSRSQWTRGYFVHRHS